MKIVYCNVEKVVLAWGPNSMTFSGVQHHYDELDPTLVHEGSNIKSVVAEDEYDPEMSAADVQTILDNILG